ncbi:MAG: hypothetical protein H9901_00815 [Candidatus Paralactobacillus gallistercoris]|uniref:Phage minor capsid protein 2 n=1 Tax=Candidatus Paralactobacillus gallistercoris TaxID=2838724 RepID=A0A948TII5_9LACO|nr:hypothetical protein [Candidatus Paralactobacillus gallistercoris]
MISQNDLTKLIKQLTKHYGDLESAIFHLLAQYLKSNDLDDANAVYQWELQHNNLINDFTKNVVDVALNYRNVALADVKRLMNIAGEQIDTDIRNELVKLTGQAYISGGAQQIIDEQVTLIQNNIDVGLMGLVNRNVPSNPAANVYKQITQNAVFQVTANGKPLSRAIDDNIYAWVYNGLPTGLVNRAGAKLSLEGYSRLCVQSAVQDTFQKIRMRAMRDYHVTLGLYSQHPASRPACAPIQNKVINLVPPEDEHFNPKYDSIYNHGYGTPAGARGINCHHFISPWLEGISSKPQADLVTPEQAIKNGKIQQKQRAYERAIRQAKKQLMMAQQLGDEKGIAHYKQLIAVRQQRIRAFIKPYRFLYRDYQREQVRSFNGDTSQYKTPARFSGAINKRSQHIVDFKAYTQEEKQAQNMYLEISQRKKANVVNAIARNTGFSKKDVTTIYDHLFTKQHVIDTGEEPQYFDPDIDMAKSLMRMINGPKLKDYDKLMLQHELYESKLMDYMGMDYHSAHELTNTIYNYQEAVKKEK